jgi:predicted component of type VI protein secretion system
MNVKLLVVQGRPAGKILVFPQGEYYIGRGAECHIRSNSDWVSRQHCLLRVVADGATLRDLGSRNGTLVNGALVDRERGLAEGDQVQVGPLVFEVHLEVTPPRPVDEVADATLSAVDSLDATDGGAANLVSTEHHPILPKNTEPKKPRKG